MIVIQAALNNLIQKHPIFLPEFNLIDYTVGFNYQDSALGLGLNVAKKAHIHIWLLANSKCVNLNIL